MYDDVSSRGFEGVIESLSEKKRDKRQLWKIKLLKTYGIASKLFVMKKGFSETSIKFVFILKIGFYSCVFE
jgi:hypothetical protein